MPKVLTLRALRTLTRRSIEAVHHVRYGHLPDRTPADKLIGMTNVDEQRFYEKCVATVNGINGEIVDLGCWMCSTTIPLVKGLRECSASDESPAPKVYAFDRFIWEKWMNPYMSKLFCHYLCGESFLPEARARLGDMQYNVQLIQADLTDYVWRNGSIRILLVDAMKNFKLAQNITKSFFPYLAMGALVIHQDFKHFYTPWIHILQYRLRNYFRFYYETQAGSTVAFETVQEIPNDVAASVLQTNEISNDEVEAVFQYSLDLVGDSGKSAVAAAHVMHYVHKKETRLAWDTVERYAKQLANPEDRDFCLAKQSLEKLA